MEEDMSELLNIDSFLDIFHISVIFFWANIFGQKCKSTKSYHIAMKSN